MFVQLITAMTASTFIVGIRTTSAVNGMQKEEMPGQKTEISGTPFASHLHNGTS